MAATVSNEEAIFYAALEIRAAAQRSAYLDAACANQAALRNRIEALLRRHEEAAGPLDRPGPGLPATCGEAVTERPGTIIGPYKLLEQIGEGGFGVVFLAEQSEPLRRKVALKVLKPGMDTQQVVARFEAERQALAIMDHPNIAKVHDGGATASGRPYFVMELVQGVPITRYCDVHHLTLKQRLDLFLRACEAVQHAHQKGVIHRDLKPSNVLVGDRDDKPVLKVIDFGVAKALGQQLTEKTIFTGLTQMIGTPLYMSPEQARGGPDIDTRSDIYSLGVVLYELLTGTTPIDKERLKRESYDGIRRIICEEEPQKPSARLGNDKRAKEVRGELDWIVMKCLEKERHRRYDAASALARDLERYLSGEPVLAHPPSTIYRMRKFVQRNKAPLASAVCLCLLIAGLAISIGWGLLDRSYRRAEAVREAAAARSDVAQLHRKGKWTAALAVARRVETLLASAGADPELCRQFTELSRDMKMAADLEEARLHENDTTDGQFDLQGVDAKYAAAFRAFGIDIEELGAVAAAERIRERTIAEELAAALDDWATVRAPRDPTGAERLRAVARAADPDPVRNRVREAIAHPETKILVETLAADSLERLPPASLILLAEALGRKESAENTVTLLRKAQWLHPDDFWINHGLALQLREFMKPPRTEEALRYCLAARALRPESPGLHILLGDIWRDLGKLPDAMQAYRRALQLKPDSALAQYNLGSVLFESHDPSAALQAYRRAIELKPDYAEAHCNLAQILRQLGKLPEARETIRRAIQIKPELANAHTSLGNVLVQLGELAEAVECQQRALQLRPDYAEAHVNLGMAYRAQGRFAESLASLRRGHELGSKAGWRHPSATWVRVAERLLELDKRLPLVLWGAEQVTNPSEQLEFAELCYWKQLFGVAAGFYDAAFAMQPELATKRNPVHRYKAAQAAALAGCGQGKDDPPLDEAARARWRGKALDWLTAELAMWTKEATSGKPDILAVTQRTLEQWQNERDFAGVRDVSAVAKLPAQEQCAWCQLWTDLAAVLKQAKQKNPGGSSQ
jgi:serine/threonine-protein kinase